MIQFDAETKVFRLDTHHTSYWFRVQAFGQLEQVYFGAKQPSDQDIEPFLHKRTAFIGSAVTYDKSDPLYCLDHLCLEWSGTGMGDYRHAPCEIRMPDGTFTNDFIYESHRIISGDEPPAELPGAYGADETLAVTLRDHAADVELLLIYGVFESADVITRRAVIQNNEKKDLVLRRMLSMNLDIPNRDYQLITFDGGWSSEGNRHDRALDYGIYINSSTTGASSNRHNPGLIIAERGASENQGRVIGLNLIYSGNHFGLVERSNLDLVRLQIGIHSHCFEWRLQQGERFETPEAVLSFSDSGLNGLSANFHDFVNEHIVRGEWKGKERPVLLNNWEAYFFKFTRGKLLRLARRAKRLGAEMFVLDDGWFGKRDSDTAGLGDYSVNKKKLPRGLREFSDRIHDMNMMFGLWFEPEMVNEDSDLYRAHPDWALTSPNRAPAQGRNQLVLDLTNPAVRNYIVENVGRCLDDGNVDYVKWDMNRHISDACSATLERQGEFFHRYILGLYDILGRVFSPRPKILFESCSSGGNRFDLGMLCFSPQCWTSDDTDPIERLKIQGGMSYLYPLSVMGAHVSEAPHQQTLRRTPLNTRFNVSVFGCLGYELDLKYLNFAERREVRRQIAFYKEHRRTLQFGRFYRADAAKENKVVWHCVAVDGCEAVTGFFQTLSKAAEPFDRLALKGLNPTDIYRVSTREQPLFIAQFGGLVKHILPVTLHPNGLVLRTVNKFYTLTDCVEQYEGYGSALMDGILLNNQFMGSYYNTHTRLLGDFGSSLFLTKKTGGNENNGKG